jgi:RNA polymerase sigma factor (sigma-70 family)
MKATNFNQIYKGNYPMVYNFIFARVNYKSELAQELTNDVFLKVHDHLASFDSSKSKLTTWIFNIAKNRVIDHYRSDKSKMVVSVDSFVNDEGKESFQFESKSNEGTHNKEVYQQIKKAMKANLKPVEYKIANLHFIMDLGYDEICNIMEISNTNARVMINRIRTKLRPQLMEIYQTA